MSSDDELSTSDFTYTVELEIEEGDIIKHNDHVWVVEEKERHMGRDSVWLDPLSGAGQRLCLTPEELSERLNFSGEVHKIKEAYRDVVDY